MLDYTDPKPLGRGYIGLQFRSGKIEFRNVKLKPLGMKSLFNGKDLTGWKTYPEMKSVFTVTPGGELHVKNGRGQLETAGQYGDFTLQLEAFVNGKAPQLGRVLPLHPRRGDERLRVPDSQRLQGRRPRQAGRLRHRRHLPPPGRPPRGRRRLPVVLR